MPAVGRYEILLGGERIEAVKEFKYLATLLCKHEEMEEKIKRDLLKEGVTSKDYERKKCVHGGEERFKEPYSPVNTDIWIRNLDME